MSGYYYRKERWDRRIMVHNRNVLRLNIPLQAAEQLNWHPGDVLTLNLHQNPPGLSVTRDRDTTKGDPRS